MLRELIDTRDNWELVLDRVTEILATESAHQQALAVAAFREPAPWAWKTYKERRRLVGEILGDDADFSPMVNVSMPSLSAPLKGSDAVQQQKHTAQLNVDCYGYGVARATDDGGSQVPADVMAYEACARTSRTVRKILMSADNVFLGMQGIVGKRSFQGLTFLDATEPGVSPVVIVGRLSFEVSLFEDAPQHSGTPFAGMLVKIVRSSDGLVIAELELPDGNVD